MDALYSLRSRSTSRDSVDSFDLISTDSASTKQTAHVHAHLSDSEFASDVYDDDDWEVLSDDDNEHNNNSTDDALTVDEPSAAIEPNVRVLQTHFDVSADANASDAKAPREPECEPELEATRPQPLTQAHRAKESLKAFYLARASEAEAKHRAIAVTAPPRPTESRRQSPPPPQRVILPLKAPVRYSVAVQEQAIETANARRAAAALEQFYVARALAKQARAALNRLNEPELIQSQSGRGALVRSTAAAPEWDAMQHVLTR